MVLLGLTSRRTGVWLVSYRECCCRGARGASSLGLVR